MTRAARVAFRDVFCIFFSFRPFSEKSVDAKIIILDTPLAPGFHDTLVYVTPTGSLETSSVLEVADWISRHGVPPPPVSPSSSSPHIAASPTLPPPRGNVVAKEGDQLTQNRLQLLRGRPLTERRLHVEWPGAHRPFVYTTTLWATSRP